MAGWKHRLPFFKPDVRADVDDELRFHLDARIAEYESRGYPHAEAVRMARGRFGDPDRVRQALETHDLARVRHTERREYMDQLLHDVRIAMRGLRRTPWFTLTVLATLAIGLGANAAVFSVVSRVLIDPLPYHDPERLVLLYSSSARDSRGFVSPNEIQQLQRSSRSLTSVAAFGWYAGYTYVGDRETLSWQGVSVGPNFFQTLGVRPALGRLIDERDVDGGAAKVVVLSHGLWRQAFGGDPDVIGRAIRLGDARWTVIGVAAPDFAPPARAPQIWTPLDLRQFLGDRRADAPILQAVARLADDVPLSRAQSEIRLVGERAAASGAPSPLPLTLLAVPIRDAIVGDVRPMLLVVMGAALLVLALACVNVAGLFLARATARGREMAVRAALGAGPWRIARQLVTETTVLGVAGGAIGVLLAYWSRTALLRLGALVLPATGAPPSIDGPVVAFVCLTSMLIGIAAGVIPALVAARGRLSPTLVDGNRGATGGRASVRAGRVLVAGQMALALLLLVGAGLLGRTLFALEHTSLGFDASRHVLSVTVALPRSYATPDSQVRFFSDWLSRIRAVRGVQAAGVIGISPWNGWNHEPIQIEHGPDGASASIQATVGRASDGYLAAVGTALVDGRAFEASDRAGSLPVALVSERFARLAWPGRRPIGERVRLDGAEREWRTVVGVAADVRENASRDLDATIYVPAWQSPQRWYEALIRTSGDAAALVPAVRSEARALDPTLPVLAPRTLDEILSVSLASTRLPVVFTTAFALLALVLSALGVYGIVAYSVALRTRELGIRAALGGKRADIVRLVLSEGLVTAVAGTAIGAVLAILSSRLLTKLLVGVTPRDPATFAAAAGVLLAVSVAACLIPARRATRISPVDALRSE
ncbi:MAG TPA: ABC transporter permease [Vicinamibacterales bacterium]|nr:ABC transporter permease [Vicinamibacterales bacterium]